jgi:uncharacterized protein
MARWDRIITSGNVEDRRGTGPAMAFAGGGGIVILLLTLGLNFLGLNIPQSTVEEILSTVQSLNTGAVSQVEQPVEFRGDDSYEVFTRKVLGSANDTWRPIFASNKLTYQEPKLVLFRGVTQSGCGIASAQSGPHYCPADNVIYLDETFFDELRSRFGADTGEVAQAYVIAHEVGHHVQNQLGALGRGQPTQARQIALELQADCYAGVWAHGQAKNGIFEGGEINQALSAAAAVGDDNIQKSTTGRVNPETWTHGSSEQRVNAFNTGYNTGQPSQCVDL